MSDRNTARDAARRRRRRDTFAELRCCVLCPYSDPASLVRVPTHIIPKHLLEDHHVLGRVNGHATVPLCRNCHGEVTEGYRVAGVSMKPQPTVLHRLRTVLRALGTFFRSLCVSIDRWATDLDRFIDGLNSQWPDWAARMAQC